MVAPSVPSRAARVAMLGKPGVFALACAPLVKLGVDAAREHLTANPIAEVMNRLGFWTLTLLVVSLSPTPLKTLFGWTWPLRVRRMLGLFTFFYACVHLATYLALDQVFDIGDIGRDIVKRKFITVGFAAFLLLVPLALTSTNAAVKRLGFPRWKRLHRLAYVAVVLALVHFVWRVKADYLEPGLFAGVVAVLFLLRVVEARRRQRGRAPRAGSPRAAAVSPSP
jgi:sulfoxide reductase heme-binding subunit YedZ